MTKNITKYNDLIKKNLDKISKFVNECLKEVKEKMLMGESTNDLISSFASFKP
mgnify:CR=1 FL=1